MIQVKIKPPDLRKLGLKLKQVINPQAAIDFNKDVVPEAKRLISAGLSPVAGFGRYDGYVDERNKKALRAKKAGNKLLGIKETLPKKPPGVYPAGKKPLRPINLFLTGEMLRYFLAEYVGRALRMGISNQAPQKVKDRAEGNNLGVPSKNVPARRFVPLTSIGETWTVSIMRKVKNVFALRVKKLLSK